MEPETKTDLERVTEVWDKAARDRAVQPVRGWLDSRIVDESYIRPRISGSPDIPWIVGLAERLRIPIAGRWLSLGCGVAEQEIIAAKAGLFGSLTALDASPASLEEGRRAAAEQGISTIEFGTVDFNRFDPPPENYDVVLMNMSLHHVKELRSVLARVHRTLRRDGFFLINEFIGPRQFQFTDLQLRIVRELLEILPARYLRDWATGDLKNECVRMPVEHWNRTDPSEAIWSDRIVPEIERQFRVVERIDYGGTILNLLLEHIAHNFDPADEKDVAIIRLLAKTEDLLIRGGVLPSDFTVMAMRRRPRPLMFLRRLRLRFLKEQEVEDDGSGEIRAAAEIPFADFRQRAHGPEVVSGFHRWEASGRWMGRRGELALRMTSNRMTFVFAAPLTELRRRHPDWTSLDVRVRLEEAKTGRGVDLEGISVAEDRPAQFLREVPEPFASLAMGRAVRVLLECQRVWVPAETLPGSQDPRELTVQVLQAGFEGGS